MTHELMESKPLEAKALETVLIQGDLSKLTPLERMNYYKLVCQSLTLNPLTKPFDYIQLNGKLVLYAKRDCTDQLRANQQISVSIVGRDQIGGCYVVTAQARTPDGRVDESTGVVPIDGLKPGDAANAYMKAETKAKRRVTLSIVGLGWFDETEIENTEQAKPVVLNEQNSASEHGPLMPPYFGKYAGKSITDPGVPVSALEECLLGKQKQLEKGYPPERERFRANDEALAAALVNEIATRNKADIDQEPAHDAETAEALEIIKEAVTMLSKSEKGTKHLLKLNKQFKVSGYTKLLPEHYSLYLDGLQSAQEELTKNGKA